MCVYVGCACVHAGRRCDVRNVKWPVWLILNWFNDIYPLCMATAMRHCPVSGCQPKLATLQQRNEVSTSRQSSGRFMCRTFVRILFQLLIKTKRKSKHSTNRQKKEQETRLLRRTGWDIGCKSVRSMCVCVRTMQMILTESRCELLVLIACVFKLPMCGVKQIATSFAIVKASFRHSANCKRIERVSKFRQTMEPLSHSHTYASNAFHPPI